MGTGLLDEETAVMAHLMLERARGDMSPLAPWLKALPAGFSTTLYFGEKQMEELKVRRCRAVAWVFGGRTGQNCFGGVGRWLCCRTDEIREVGEREGVMEGRGDACGEEDEPAQVMELGKRVNGAESQNGQIGRCRNSRRPLLLVILAHFFGRLPGS